MNYYNSKYYDDTFDSMEDDYWDFMDDESKMDYLRNAGIDNWWDIDGPYDGAEIYYDDLDDYIDDDD